MAQTFYYYYYFKKAKPEFHGAKINFHGIFVGLRLRFANAEANPGHSLELHFIFVLKFKKGKERKNP